MKFRKLKTIAASTFTLQCNSCKHTEKKVTMNKDSNTNGYKMTNTYAYVNVLHKAAVM